jgi:hypothetical protein
MLSKAVVGSGHNVHTYNMLQLTKEVEQGCDEKRGHDTTLKQYGRYFRSGSGATMATRG